MTFITRWFVRSFTVAALLAGLGVAGAQPTPADVDPPGRAARLSEFSGQVWLFNADSGEWVSAVRNRPITTGDRLATDPGARAEFQLGSTTVRLDASTELAIVALDDDRLSMQLVNGSASARIADLSNAGQVDVTTDEGRFVVQRSGSYRFDRDERASHITVLSGLARYEGPNSGLPVTAGQRAEFWVDSGGVAQYALSPPVNDGFTAWNNERDRLYAARPPVRYVSPEMTGAEELDRYGRWEQSPDYGALWIPTAVAVDWAPYRNGHWAWVRPWGWTWVDDAPWGFAPFHYGRWVYVRNNWCWTPGQRVVRPVYAPALVAWVGGPRANVSITVGGGGPAVGWFPLAPREVYVPSYRVTPRYAERINITNVTNVTVINNVFANPQRPREFDNRRYPNAITVVPAGVMTSRQPVAPAAAQWRKDPAARDFVNNQRPDRAVALIEPPVAAPPVRNVDPRAVRPPPGAAERPVAGRPGFPPQDRGRDGNRDDRGRDAGRPDNARPMPPVAVQPPAPAVLPAPAATPRPAPPMNAGDRRDDRRDDRRRDNAPPPAVAVQPTPAPAPTPIARPAVVAPPVQEAPTMRTQPVQRGEDRRVSPRPAESAPMTNQPRPPAAPRVERPAPVAPPAPVVAPQPPQQRPAEVARPPEVRPAPQPAPEMRRPESPRPRQEAPAVEQRRGEPREPRGDSQR